MHENSKYEAKKKLARPVRSQVKEFGIFLPIRETPL